MRALAKKIFSFLEDTRVPLWYYAAAFLFVFNFRFFLEFVAYGCPLEFTQYKHYLLSYVCLGLSALLLLVLLAGTAVQQALRVVLGAFGVILVGPLVDIMVSRGIRQPLTYFRPGYHDDLLRRFFTFLGEHTSKGGVTLGVKTELCIIIAILALYVYLKTRSPLKSLAGIIFLYILAFFYAALKMILYSFLGMYGVAVPASGLRLLNYLYIILILGQLCGVLYLSNKALCVTLLRKIKITRMLHYEFMFILGVALGQSKSFFGWRASAPVFYLPHPTEVILSLPIIALAIALANIYSTMCDEITQAWHAQPIAAYWQAAAGAFLLALAAALAVDFATGVCVGLFMGAYFFYCMPPLRLQRYPVLSKIVIGFNSLIVLMLGLRVTAGRLEEVTLPVVLFCLIGITAVANFTDLKNHERDSRAGIKTLPVLLGFKDAQQFIAIFMVLAYLALVLFFKEPIIAGVLLVCALLQWHFLNLKNYREHYVYYAHLLSLLAIIIYLFLN